MTILIANLGQPDNLLRCLESLFATCRAPIVPRVIVGFNFAGESAAPKLVRQAFPQVEQVRAAGKLGYCRAYNLLMDRSTTDYLLLLDDDTVLPEGTIERMLAFMEGHPDVGIAGCRTLNPDGSYQKTTARMYSLATEFTNAVRPAGFWDDGIDERTSHWTQVGWLNGHFLLVRRRAFEAVGGLDERYYTFQCEADWCLRMRRAGWIVAYVPQAEIMHVGGGHSVATTVKSAKNFRRSHVNRFYFMRRHYGDSAILPMRFLMAAGALLRLATYVGVWAFRPPRRPEASGKIAAFSELLWLCCKRRPDALPDSLRADNEAASALTFHQNEARTALPM